MKNPTKKQIVNNCDVNLLETDGAGFPIRKTYTVNELEKAKNEVLANWHKMDDWVKAWSRDMLNEMRLKVV